MIYGCCRVSQQDIYATKVFVQNILGIDKCPSNTAYEAHLPDVSLDGVVGGNSGEQNHKLARRVSTSYRMGYALLWFP